MDNDMDNCAYYPKSGWTFPPFDYFCTELKRNIDYGKTGYCHKRKNPFRIS